MVFLKDFVKKRVNFERNQQTTKKNMKKIPSMHSSLQLSPPNSVQGPMRELFIQQEDTRYSLRLQHLIERVGVTHILLTRKASNTTKMILQTL